MCSRCWPPSPGLGGRPQRTTPGGPTWDRRSCCKSLPEPRRSIPASLGIDPIRDLDNSASKTLARFGNFLRASCGFASALTGGGSGMAEAAGPAPPPAVTSSLAGIALRGGGSIWSAGGAGWQAGPAPPAAGGAACTIYSTRTCFTGGPAGSLQPFLLHSSVHDVGDQRFGFEMANLFRCPAIHKRHSGAKVGLAQCGLDARVLPLEQNSLC